MPHNVMPGVTCPDCNGRGEVPRPFRPEHMMACQNCRGTGKIMDFTPQVHENCRDCGASMEPDFGHVCRVCGGPGNQMPEEPSDEEVFPAGVEPLVAPPLPVGKKPAKKTAARSPRPKAKQPKTKADQ